jgi:hypothetical protein
LKGNTISKILAESRAIDINTEYGTIDIYNRSRIENQLSETPLFGIKSIKDILSCKSVKDVNLKVIVIDSISI